MKTLLFNPFAKYDEKILLISGLIATLVGGFTGYFFNAAYDGALDLHLVAAITASETAEFLLINIVTIVLFLFLAAKCINRKTRLVDILSTALIARIPLYILPFFNVGNYLYNITSNMTKKLLESNTGIIFGTDTIFMLLFAMVTMAFVVWFFALLWNGFKVATNAKGILHVVFFIAAVLLAEIFSKITLIYL
ncbi:MAG: hypothetical protein PSV16_09980 [Flavobacterium sp.]|nr:hypothetical protein [Flavobacterium sp.]